MRPTASSSYRNTLSPFLLYPAALAALPCRPLPPSLPYPDLPCRSPCPTLPYPALPCRPLPSPVQDPKDKRKIIVDKELGKIFTSPLTMFSINAQLSKHVKSAGAPAGLLDKVHSLRSGHVHAEEGQGVRFLPLARSCYLHARPWGPQNIGSPCSNLSSFLAGQVHGAESDNDEPEKGAKRPAESKPKAKAKPAKKAKGDDGDGEAKEKKPSNFSKPGRSGGGLV